MQTIINLVTRCAVTVAVGLVTVSSAWSANFEKFSCATIPNTKQRTYNTQVTCTATIARPGTKKWYSAVAQDCPTFCAGVGGYNTPSPDGFSCVSGEVRGWSAIGVVNFAPTGCWHDCGQPEGRPGSISVGYRCYSPGQKRDNDRTDMTLGCFCATGDIGSTPIEVGIHGSGSASVSGASSKLSGWESVIRSVMNDVPGRMFDVLGSVPLAGSSKLDMVVNVKGACGTSAQLSGTIAHPNNSLVRSPEVWISLPSCVSQCADGIDNDGDGAVDYPADTGCGSAQDDDETNPALPRVTPIAECVDLNQDGSLVAHFGYQNDASSAVEVAIGGTNYMTPGAANRGQPTTFVTGRISNAFTVTIPSTQTLTWIVGTTSAAAGIATQRCQTSPLGCVDTDNSNNLSALDSTARAQRTNIRRLSARILSVQSTGATAAKAESYKQLAQSLYLEQWAEIWGSFPKVSRNCTSCASVDMSAEITDINTRAQRMNRVARQASALLKDVRRGRLRRDEQVLVSDASDLYDSFVQLSQNLPRFESKCN